MVTALLVTGGVGLAACSGGGGDDGVATLGGDASGGNDDAEGATEADPEEAFRKWAQCMRNEGVDVPDPQVDGDSGGVIINGPLGGGANDPEAFEAAQEVCQEHIDGVVNNAEGRAVDPEQEAEMREWALDFAACMRGQGIDFPDPDFNGGGVMQRLPEGLDPTAVEAAQQHCEEELGDAPGGGARTRGSGGGSPTIGGGDE